MAFMSRSLLGAAVAVRVTVATLVPMSQALALSGGIKLPDPYVSRALDAVLVPVDDEVRKVFKLSSAEKGVLVLSVRPGGIADKQGIKPGDVIAKVHGHAVAKPVDVDTVTYYWIKEKNTDSIPIRTIRDGKARTTTPTITLALFEAAIDVAAIATWESWSTQTSFSYAEFASEYSSEISESYGSSEATVEATATLESFESEMASEAQSKAKDSDGEGTADAADTDDANDGTPDAQDGDDADGDGGDGGAEGGDGDSGGDDNGGGDEGGGDDGGDE